MGPSWKIYYDPGPIGSGRGVSGLEVEQNGAKLWTPCVTVADRAGERVDRIVPDPEDAPGDGVLLLIYADPRVGRRVIRGADFYVWHPAAEHAPGFWIGGDETTLFSAVERGHVFEAKASGDPELPYLVRNGQGAWVACSLVGFLTWARGRRGVVKRGYYTSDAHMERVLIAAHNDPDLPPVAGGPPHPAWRVKE